MVKHKMTKVFRLNIIIIIILFISGSGLVQAASFYSPVPAPVSAQVNFDLQLDLFKKDNLEIGLTFGPGITFAVFPISVIPAFSVNTGVDMSFFFIKQEEGLFMAAGTGLSLFFCPFIYDNELHSMDVIAAVDIDLSAGYRLNIVDNFSIEPSVGAKLSLNGSLTKYSGVFCYPGIFAELNFIFKI
ncbi:MAG: hypothetical protein JEZ04_02765 [Spirochaetales bacterium]|nr:hypothetical protein [Spirochaetales bacterium]